MTPDPIAVTNDFFTARCGFWEIFFPAASSMVLYGLMHTGKIIYYRFTHHLSSWLFLSVSNACQFMQGLSPEFATMNAWPDSSGKHPLRTDVAQSAVILVAPVIPRSTGFKDAGVARLF